jgi:hypothetical protein
MFNKSGIPQSYTQSFLGVTDRMLYANTGREVDTTEGNIVSR